MTKIEVSPRTAEAVELVAQGHDYAQAAHRMGISVRSVKRYVYTVAEQIDGKESPLQRVVRWYWRAHPERPFEVRGHS